MATTKRPFTLRLQEANYEKIMYISEKNKRSMSMEIEFLIEQYIEDYEKRNGKIDLNENK